MAKMDGGQRTLYHVLLLVVGTATIFLSGFTVIHYNEYFRSFVAPREAAPVPENVPTLAETMARLPRCATTCIFNEITVLGCAHSDFACMCTKLETLGNPDNTKSKRQFDFKTCLQACPITDQWHAPGALLDICDVVDTEAALPEFMAQNYRIHGRQFSSIQRTTRNTILDDIITTTYTTTSTVAAWRSRTTSIDADIGAYGATKWILVPSSGVNAAGVATARSATSFASGRAARSSTSTSRGSFSTSSSSSSSSSSRRRRGGFSTGAKIAIGVIIPVIIIIIAGLLRFCVARRKKKQAAAAAGTSGDGPDQSNITPTPGVVELGGKEQQEPPAYQKSATTDHAKEVVPLVVTEPEKSYYGTPPTNSQSLPEVDDRRSSHFGVLSATGGVSPGTQHAQQAQDISSHELPGNTASRGELPSTPAQTYNPTIGRKPLASSSPQSVSPPPQSSSPPPWDRSYGTDFTLYQPSELSATPAVSVTPQGTGSSVSGNTDLRALEEEMARIKAQKERLHALQALEEREEELKRTIEAKKSAGA